VADKPIRSFSKGMTQRVAIAQALCIRPRLLILDEPLSGLDPIGRRDVVEILSEYKRSGGTLFFTSHVLHDVERLADRFGLIHQGVLRAVRAPAELTGDEEMVLVRSLRAAAGGRDARGLCRSLDRRGAAAAALAAPRSAAAGRARAARGAADAVARGGFHARCRRVLSRWPGPAGIRSADRRLQPGSGAAMTPDSIALLRLVEASRYPEVEAAARRMLASQPRHPLALKALGFALIGQGRYDDALPVVRFSLERNAHDPEAHNNLGIVLSALMRWDESLACFRRSIEIKPDDPEVLKNFGVALVRMHKWNEAVPFCCKRHRVPPGRLRRGDRATRWCPVVNSNRNDEAWVCLNELCEERPGQRGDPVATAVRQSQALRLGRAGAAAARACGR
jgi:tetratricopeptide (TPR) repeat protein